MSTPESICPDCGAELPPIYENQGWNGYDGPRVDEIVGYKNCSECQDEE